MKGVGRDASTQKEAVCVRGGVSDCEMSREELGRRVVVRKCNVRGPRAKPIEEQIQLTGAF